MSLNYFDKIYYINCDHRTDRLNHINNVLLSLNVDFKKVVRISGVFINENGSLGCAKSHLFALNDIRKNNYQKSLIMEDDFVPIDYETFNLKVSKLFNKDEIKEWEVVMLSGNIKKSSPSIYSEFHKVEDVQTTSSYSIDIKMVDRLIENFEESCTLLQNGVDRNLCAIDQNWKKLQKVSKWYIFYPVIGRQIDDYSDIEKRIVNYKC
jgi:hypothetical protein